MNHDTSRNATYEAVLAGRYSTIRMFEMGKNVQPDTSKTDFFIIPPADTSMDLDDGTLSGWRLPSAGTTLVVSNVFSERFFSIGTVLV